MTSDVILEDDDLEIVARNLHFRATEDAGAHAALKAIDGETELDLGDGGVARLDRVIVAGGEDVNVVLGPAALHFNREEPSATVVENDRIRTPRLSADFVHAYDRLLGASGVLDTLQLGTGETDSPEQPRPGSMTLKDDDGHTSLNVDGAAGLIAWRKAGLRGEAPMMTVFETLPDTDDGGGSGSSGGGGLGRLGGAGSGGVGGVGGVDLETSVGGRVTSEGLLDALESPVDVIALAEDAPDTGLALAGRAFRFQAEGETVMEVELAEDGNVGVGGAATADHKLHVEGRVRAEGVDTPSDLRLKRDVAPIENARGKIARLRGVSFRPEGSDARAYGLVAQEVREVLPETVHESDDGLLSVAYPELVPVLLEAAKDASGRLDALERENRDLRDALARAEARLDRLEAAGGR